MFVIQARLGAPLQSHTILELEALNAKLIIDKKINPATWFNYANKIAAVKIAQNLATTELIAWLDSDILVNQPPTELILSENIDFAARGEYLPPAIHEDKTENIPYWTELTKLFNCDYSNIPQLMIDHRQLLIRMYFNSGVFVWRRSSNFAELYFEYFKTLLHSRLAQHDGEFFTADQVILTPIILRNSLRWMHLGYKCHHMTFQFQIDGTVASPSMDNSALIHYSRSLDEKFRVKFLKRLELETPKLYAFVLADLANEKRNANERVGLVFRKVLARVLRIFRGVFWRIYASRVKRAARG